jgi:hypothetical protein
MLPFLGYLIFSKSHNWHPKSSPIGQKMHNLVALHCMESSTHLLAAENYYHESFDEI